MRRWTLIALLLALAAAPAHAKREYLKVVVAEPFIEMRTGPGEGYPVVQVADRGAEILVLKRRTDWFKVRTDRDIEGWVREDQLSQTMQAGGEPVVVDDPGWEDYAGRRWETAISLGDFDGATSISLTGAWRTSANLAVELLAAQISGDFSDGWMAGVRLVHTPFPEWRVAPYLVLGTGVVHITPRTSLVSSEDRSDQYGQAGVGLRLYLADRFMFRAEYTGDIVFTSRDDNEEVDEWKAGFAFFF